MKWLVLVLLVGCDGTPTFVTSQGFEFYLDPAANVTVEQLSRTIDIVVEEALKRHPKAERTIESYEAPVKIKVVARRFIVGSQEVHGATTGWRNEIKIAAVDDCEYQALAHEWGHLLAFTWVLDGDIGHSDSTLFHSPDSLTEASTGRIWLEVCHPE